MSHPYKTGTCYAISLSKVAKKNEPGNLSPLLEGA
jgi:hypothetical protein